MKNIVHVIIPHMLGKLKENIWTMLSSIGAEKLVHVNEFLRWCELSTSYRMDNISSSYCEELSTEFLI